ncbi:MAG: PAS domain-containing sensor histidine kinase [Chloroflexi bacterium]|nr:PAS domain-containing sensor histidine kinase [Chloroflexota bacterium]
MSPFPFDNSHLLFRALFEQTHDAVFVLDLEGRHLAANPRAAEMLGYTPDEILGLSFRQIVVADEQDSSESIRQKMLAGKLIPVYERHFRRKDGSICLVEVNVQMVRDLEGKPLYIQSIVRDISGRKAAEEQALRLAFEEERGRILSDFIIASSHEFRTPLSNINTSLHIMRQLPEPTEHEKRMRVIQDQVDRIAALVSRMLLMTRLDRGEAFNFASCDLGDILYDAEVTVSRLFEQRLIQVEHRIDETLPAIPGDSRYLHMAFVELLDNAAKYTPVSGRIVIETTARQGHIVAAITDTGNGIPERDRPRVFNRFFRGDPSHNQKGFGLGLAIVQKIIERHGGHVEFESAAGQGSTFRVLLPTPHTVGAA